MTDDATSSDAECEHQYSLIRAQIEHEDDLVGQRLSWLVTSQAFFFTGYAILLSNSGTSHTQAAGAQIHRLLSLLPLVAELTCGLIYLSILAGVWAMRDLRRKYDPVARCAPAMLPLIQGRRRTPLLGHVGPLLVPPVFLVVWIILRLPGSL